jgi:perosamine synthetase
MKNKLTRRQFVAAIPVGGLAATALRGDTPPTGKPALLGGEKSYAVKHIHWPIFDEQEEQAIVTALRSGKWNRNDGPNGERFEKAFAQMMGANYCLATNSGTSALLTSLSVLGVGAGDEVILPPYTFVATANVILALHALPVFVDIDPATQQIDASKIEAAITNRTAAILPVHLGGNVADLDAIMAIAKRKKLPVVEDACQAHLSEWRGQKVGTYGATGCFSFQESKNMTSGDGGALLTNDQELKQKAFSFHSASATKVPFYAEYRGLNLRMTEFQAAVAAVQMTRLEEQAKIRTKNAEYLASMLKEIPGIQPASTYAGCTRNAYHIMPLRYQKEHFAGMDRVKFLKAAKADGLPIEPGYHGRRETETGYVTVPGLNHQPFLENTFETRGYRKVFSKQEIERWKERNHTPESDLLGDEGCWIYQTTFLHERTDMERIAEGLRKIQLHAGELARTS